MTVSDRNIIPLDPKQPTKMTQTVDPKGKSTLRRIEGVEIRDLITHPDGRGTVTELYDLRWNHHPEPLVYTYYVTIRPNQVKGWIKHAHQDDRIAIMEGAIQVVLYDDRADSPTHGLVNDMTFGTNRRALITIPRGVYHALRNVDLRDSVFVNHPTQPYNHDDPDKHLLPIENDLIPYRFK
jgi:dTDP-4-dehydrorhamnose 3,5-epimerase